MANNHRRSREEIRQLVCDFEKSGQSLSEFSKANAVHSDRLKRWIHREKSEEPQARLVQVKIRQSAENTAASSRENQVEVTLSNGRLVRVSLDVDLGSLARFIDALERPC